MKHVLVGGADWTSPKVLGALRGLLAAGLLSTVPWTTRAPSAQADGKRISETVTRLEITQPTGAMQAWAPQPLSQDTDWFQTLEYSISGNFDGSRIFLEPVDRAAIVAVTLNAGGPQPVVEVASRFRTPYRKVALKPGAGMLATTAELATILKPTDFMPTDGIVRETALEITKRARTDVDKGRAVYEWFSRTPSAIRRPEVAASTTSRRCWRPRP